MCAIVLAHQVHPELPLVVGANRDELYARPTAPPGVLVDEPLAAGGRDLAQGGTWMGVTEGGLFVGLTNQRPTHPPVPARRSRGAVVLEALRRGSYERALALIGELDAADYNPFNLVVGDGRALSVAYVRPDAARPEVHALPPGLWVLPSERLDAPGFPKVERARELVRPALGASWPVLAEALKRTLADHELPAPDRLGPPPEGSWLTPEMLRALQALCIHTPAYGTRSATLLAVAPDRVLHYLYADGAPCTAAFVDYTHLLRRRDAALG